MARCSSISQLRCKPLRDFEAFGVFPLLVSLSVLAGYIVLGAAWLHLKGTGALQTFAERTLRLATPVFLGPAAAACIAAALVQPRVQAVWTQHHPMLIVIVVLFVLVALMLCVRSADDRTGGRPFAFGLTLSALGVLGLGYVIFPDIVPFQLRLWAAASSTLSHVFLLVGAAIVTPVVLGYSAFAYRAFPGKTPQKGWEV